MFIILILEIRSTLATSCYSNKTFPTFQKKHFQTTLDWAQGVCSLGKFVCSWILAHYLENTSVWQHSGASMPLAALVAKSHLEVDCSAGKRSDSAGHFLASFERISPWRRHGSKVFFVTNTNKSFLDFLSRGYVRPQLQWQQKSMWCIYLLHF